MCLTIDYLYTFHPDVTVMVDTVLRSSHLYICLHLTHFQPCEWLGAQIQSSIYLPVSDSLSAVRVAGY